VDDVILAHGGERKVESSSCQVWRKRTIFSGRHVYTFLIKLAVTIDWCRNWTLDQ